MEKQQVKTFRYFLGIGLLIGIFLVLSWSYHYSPIAKIDEQCSKELYDLGGTGWDRFFIGMSWLGSAKLSFPLILILTGFFLYKRHVWLAAILVFNLAGVRLLNRLLKMIFNRERPDLELLFPVGGESYPSGHVMNTTAFFGFLLFMWWHRKQQRGQKAWVEMVLIISMIVLVGISRIYVGAHYPIDVLAGYTAGAVWLIVSIYVYRLLERRKVIR